MLLIICTEGCKKTKYSLSMLHYIHSIVIKKINKRLGYVIHMCIYLYTHMYMHTHTYTHINTNIYLYIYLHTYLYITVMIHLILNTLEMKVFREN